MNDLNSIILEGNLVKKPDIRFTPKGVCLCRFSLANNYRYITAEEKREEVSFFDVEAWSKLAEECRTHLDKGRGVRVVGRLKQSRWQDVSGKPRSKMVIVAEHVEFKPISGVKNESYGNNNE